MIYDPCCGSAGLLIKCQLVLQESLSKGTIENTKIPFPQRKEQDEIAYILDGFVTEINNSIAKKELLQDLFHTLLHQLITAQIRVEELNLSALNLEPQGGNE